MPSMQNRPRSLFGPKSHADWGPFTPLPTSSFAEELPTTPLPAANSQIDQKETAILAAQRTPVPPALTRQLSNPGVVRQLSSPGITRHLSNPGVVRQLSSPGVTRQLSNPGTFSAEEEGAGPRAAVVIKGELKKPAPVALSAHAHKKRRLLVSLSGVFILALITAFALLSASPLGHDVGMNFSAQPTGNSMVSSGNGNGLRLVAQATATAISHQQQDGYDPYSNGGITVSDGSGSLNWPVGQCTYWANYRYHELTGYWVAWTGNAAQWVAGARAAGWNVSTQPHIPSILVLMPYVQGAWGYGHVAIVESVNDTVTPEVVHTSNMNWWNGNGGWDKESNYDFTVGPGVYFVWHK